MERGVGHAAACAQAVREAARDRPRGREDPLATQRQVVVGVDENKPRLRQFARARRGHVGEAAVLLCELQRRELAIFNAQLRVERKSRGAITYVERLGQASMPAPDLCQYIESR